MSVSATYLWIVSYGPGIVNYLTQTFIHSFIQCLFIAGPVSVQQGVGDECPPLGEENCQGPRPSEACLRIKVWLEYGRETDSK